MSKPELIERPDNFNGFSIFNSLIIIYNFINKSLRSSLEIETKI